MNDKPLLNIRALRERAGLTQCELAERINVRQPKISAYEQGRKTPHLSLLPRLAKALGVEISDLFSVN